jgi:hypothetical protein
VRANALISVHRALVTYTRRRIIAGARNPKLSRDVRAQGRVGQPRSGGGVGP